MKSQIAALQSAQQAVRDAAAEVERIQALRAQHSEAAAAINASVATDTNSLQKARQDALTAIALGEANGSALTEVENAIADAEQRIAGSRRAASDYEQAAAGLTARLEAAQTALRDAERNVAPARLACLEAYAESLGTLYHERLTQFIDVFVRLFALHRIIKDAGGSGTYSPYGVGGIRLPWFDFPRKKREERIRERRAFVFDSLDFQDRNVDKWLEDERTALRQMGVIE